MEEEVLPCDSSDTEVFVDLDSDDVDNGVPDSDDVHDDDGDDVRDAETAGETAIAQHEVGGSVAFSETNCAAVTISSSTSTTSVFEVHSVPGTSSDPEPYTVVVSDTVTGSDRDDEGETAFSQTAVPGAGIVDVPSVPNAMEVESSDDHTDRINSETPCSDANVITTVVSSSSSMSCVCDTDQLDHLSGSVVHPNVTEALVTGPSETCCSTFSHTSTPSIPEHIKLANCFGLKELRVMLTRVDAVRACSSSTENSQTFPDEVAECSVPASTLIGDSSQAGPESSPKADEATLLLPTVEEFDKLSDECATISVPYAVVLAEECSVTDGALLSDNVDAILGNSSGETLTADVTGVLDIDGDRFAVADAFILLESEAFEHSSKLHEIATSDESPCDSVGMKRPHAEDADEASLAKQQKRADSNMPESDVTRDDECFTSSVLSSVTLTSASEVFSSATGHEELKVNPAKSCETSNVSVVVSSMCDAVAVSRALTLPPPPASVTNAGSKMRMRMEAANKGKQPASPMYEKVKACTENLPGAVAHKESSVKISDIEEAIAANIVENSTPTTDVGFLLCQENTSGEQSGSASKKEMEPLMDWRPPPTKSAALKDMAGQTTAPSDAELSQSAEQVSAADGQSPPGQQSSSPTDVTSLLDWKPIPGWRPRSAPVSSDVGSEGNFALHPQKPELLNATLHDQDLRKHDQDLRQRDQDFRPQDQDLRKLGVQQPSPQPVPGQIPVRMMSPSSLTVSPNKHQFQTNVGQPHVSSTVSAQMCPRPPAMPPQVSQQMVLGPASADRPPCPVCCVLSVPPPNVSVQSQVGPRPNGQVSPVVSPAVLSQPPPHMAPAVSGSGPVLLPNAVPGQGVPPPFACPPPQMVASSGPPLLPNPPAVAGGQPFGPGPNQPVSVAQMVLPVPSGSEPALLPNAVPVPGQGVPPPVVHPPPQMVASSRPPLLPNPPPVAGGPGLNQPASVVPPAQTAPPVPNTPPGLLRNPVPEQGGPPQLTASQPPPQIAPLLPDPAPVEAAPSLRFDPNQPPPPGMVPQPVPPPQSVPPPVYHHQPYVPPHHWPPPHGMGPGPRHPPPYWGPPGPPHAGPPVWGPPPPGIQPPGVPPPGFNQPYPGVPSPHDFHHQPPMHPHPSPYMPPDTWRPPMECMPPPDGGWWAPQAPQWGPPQGPPDWSYAAPAESGSSYDPSNAGGGADGDTDSLTRAAREWADWQQRYAEWYYTYYGGAPPAEPGITSAAAETSVSSSLPTKAPVGDRKISKSNVSAIPRPAEQPAVKSGKADAFAKFAEKAASKMSLSFDVHGNKPAAHVADESRSVSVSNVSSARDRPSQGECFRHVAPVVDSFFNS